MPCPGEFLALSEVKERCPYFVNVYGACCLVSNHIWLFCNSMDHNLSGSSVHGISQERILVWVAVSSSRGSSPPRDQTHISWYLLWQVDSYHRANREAYTHIFSSWPSFLKGHQMAKRCSYTHWIHHHQNKHRSFCFLGIPKDLPYEEKEILEFVGKMDGFRSRNERHNNHSSVIKPKGSSPPN